MKYVFGHMAYLFVSMLGILLFAFLGNSSSAPIWSPYTFQTFVLLYFLISIAVTVYCAIIDITPKCQFIILVIAAVFIFICIVWHNHDKGGIWWNGGVTPLKYLSQCWLWIILPTHIAGIVLSIKPIMEKVK